MRIITARKSTMQIKFPEIGICGLSCRLCPRYHTEGKSRCGGCKSEYRIAVGCPFITCAIKKKGIEFCWQCKESESCEKWRKHREFSEKHDTFKCYQKLKSDISFIRKNGVNEFEKLQIIKEQILKEIIKDFNEGRSKNYFCIAATVLEIEELEEALDNAKKDSAGLEIKEKSSLLHSIIDEIAERKNYSIYLRK